MNEDVNADEPYTAWILQQKAPDEHVRQKERNGADIAKPKSHPEKIIIIVRFANSIVPIESDEYHLPKAGKVTELAQPSHNTFFNRFISEMAQQNYRSAKANVY
ncbi:hypothetical protein T11_18243 [Trichinella zimbabwensis]|uniref:Uncharacterized protein n=1 Tax=Trichinella zimbabwensis TaxID=268475 RepID=A0A0V1HCR9_9BILA|nr:hypothetical protein T11_18243 [Trichinella zimbabwensis]